MGFIIGEEIRKKLRDSGLKNKTFAEKMNMDERSLYHFFKKRQMDIDQLLLAGEVLDFDFVSLYIRNSPFKDYYKKFKPGSDLMAHDVVTPYLPSVGNNQISFSLTVCGTYEKISTEFSNFLQAVKEEAERRGLKLI